MSTVSPILFLMEVRLSKNSQSFTLNKHRLKLMFLMCLLDRMGRRKENSSSLATQKTVSLLVKQRSDESPVRTHVSGLFVTQYFQTKKKKRQKCSHVDILDYIVQVVIPKNRKKNQPTFVLCALN